MQQHGTQTVHRLGQTGQHLVGLALAGSVNDQQTRGRVYPHQASALFGKRHRQEFKPGVVFQFSGFFFAWLATCGELNLRNAFFGFAVDDGSGNRFAFNHQLHEPLTAYGFDQRAVDLATRSRPADGFFLRQTTFDKALGLQLGLQLIQRNRPRGPNAVHHHVFEHKKPFDC